MGPLSPAVLSSSDEAEPWTQSEVLVLAHEEPVLSDCPPPAGVSPDRLAARHYTVTMPEDVDRIEQAPQSTPRPDPDSRSPSRPGKRPWEGRDSDMPSAKCLVRRLGAMVPLPRPVSLLGWREFAR